MRRTRLIRLLLVLMASGTAGTDVYATDWPQFGYDAAHSGFNSAETGYSTDGNAILRHYSLGFTVDSAPIYVGGVTMANGTTKNVLYIDTKNGTIIAIDADSPTLSTLWSNRPTAANGTNSGNGAPSGSPIIDAAHQYVYAFGLDGNVHKYPAGGVTSGSPDIQTGGWPETVTNKPSVEKGAASLSISSVAGQPDYLYVVTDGYDGDGGNYQGHVTAINLADGTQHVFNAMCSNQTAHFTTGGTDCGTARGGIWGRPGAIWDPGTSRLFIATGNGNYNASTGGTNWGDSLLALNRDGTGTGQNGHPIDAFTPTTAQNLDTHDADLGSVSLALVPAPANTASQFTHIGVMGGGKDGCVRLINLQQMGSGLTPTSSASTNPALGGELQAVDFISTTHNCANGGDGPELKAQPAVWVNPADGSSWVFIASYSDGINAYKVVLQTVNSVANTPQLQKQWSIPETGVGLTTGSGSSPVIANGTLYYMSGGYVKALDAVTGNSVLSSSAAWLNTSNNGQHWQSAILVNGRVYAIDNGNPAQLWVYQLDGIFRGKFE